MLPLRQPLSTKAQKWAKIFALSSEKVHDNAGSHSTCKSCEKNTDRQDDADELIFAIEDID